MHICKEVRRGSAPQMTFWANAQIIIDKPIPLIPEFAKTFDQNACYRTPSIRTANAAAEARFSTPNFE